MLEARLAIYVPIAVQKQPQIKAAVREVEKQLAQLGVVLIKWEIGQAWDGSWAIFFRVLLTDEASKGEKLREVATSVVWRMSKNWISRRSACFRTSISAANPNRRSTENLHGDEMAFADDLLVQAYHLANKEP